jgi:GTP pyrophosphokinase
MWPEVLQKVTKYNPEADLILNKAYPFALAAHQEQKRISGEPFIHHPLAVANILADLELDIETIVAGLLHDTVEDAGISLDKIEKDFGQEVALLVDGVTKLGRLEFKSREEQQAENLRKMFLAMAKDIRVILIKLADRLHNMRTLKYQPELKQKEIAQETLDIYTPLAHRLGIYRLKWELEDLAFYFLEPAKYHELSERIAQTRSKREEYILSVSTLLKEKLNTIGIKADIEGRPKNLYSIYTKMQRQQKDLNEIYDVQGVRIIVNSIRDCYAALGTVHTLWKPIPGRFKDFIAMPKSNMYQSLHTTVVGPQGSPLEIQIRTWEMQQTAEYGIAAHWKYKEGKQRDKSLEEKLAWLRHILEWQHDLRDAREFMESLKIDLFSDVVFVFSPKGDVWELPAGSGPIDFAYRVHTQVGHSCVGAKVNGRIVSLDYKLKNGDIVEILTSKQVAGPRRDWLNLVKTSTAKNRIRQWLKKEQREENIHTIEKLKPEKKELLKVEDFQQLKIEPRSLSTRDGVRQGIKIKGIDNLLVHLAHCCNPVPGDTISGYITRGRGVSVHLADCRNINLLRTREKERIVEVFWSKEFQSPFQVKLEVLAMDRAGLLNDVMAVLTELKISANWVTARGRKNNQATVELALEIKNVEQLNFIISRINRVKDVYEIKRTS